MNGLYVDSYFRIQVIFMNYEENAWYLYGHEAEGDVGGNHAKELIVETESRKVTMVEKDGDRKHGVYDEKCIQWENSDKWTKIEISLMQWRLLTRRTYIPLTIIFFAFLRFLCQHMYNACHSRAMNVKTRVKKI